ncbi:uncharacterized protein L201_000308 [Kwoniella dendrophila CBS 6074]|uniref:Extracellular membrane protein CFEM domain-containing protein n=1 Tax=Kwoniella dendrophila CBS 6074 TaxID=1295534 RepID=A0AAX4JLL6_9TREE
MCDIATLVNTNTQLDLCCFEQESCAKYLCDSQNQEISNNSTSSGIQTYQCYLDQMAASENYDKASNGTCGGNMACALRALSTEPSVTVDQNLLPTSYSSTPSSETGSVSASSSSKSSGALPVMNQGMIGVWAITVLTLAVFGKKLHI